MHKYQISSYELQDGRWGASYVEIPSIDGSRVTFSEPNELGQYFSTKKEADEYTIYFLKKKKGALESEIKIN